LALNPLAGISSAGRLLPKSSIHSGRLTTSTSPWVTFQPSPAFSSASSIEWGYWSSTTPRRCQGISRTLNMLSLLVSP